MPGPSLSIGPSVNPITFQQTQASQGVDSSSSQVQSPTQRQIASHRLTPPPPPRELQAPREVLIDSASTKGSKEPNNTCPTRGDKANSLLKEAQDKVKEARQMGVDVAKTTFWKKMLGVAVSAVAVGVAAGLTALSFGAATPLLGLACASMAVSIGDAACSYGNYKNAQADANQQPLPYPKLRQGGNTLMGNVGYHLASALGGSTEVCKGAGAVLGGVVGLGLAASTVALSFGLGAIPMALEITSKTATSINSTVSGYSALTAHMTRDLDEDHLKSLKAQAGDLAGRAIENGVDQGEKERIDSGMDQASVLWNHSIEESGLTRDTVVGVVGILSPIGGLALGGLIGGGSSGGSGSGGETPPPPPLPGMTMIRV